jgi:hypothetical protein
MSTESGSAILAGNPTPTAPAETPATPSSGAVAPATTPAPEGSWYAGIEDSDLRGYVQNKGWKDPVELANGYRNLEKLLGGEKLPMPKGETDNEGWGRVYDALGRPKDPTGYKIASPEGADPAFSQAAASKFHELGLSAKQANELANWYNSQGTAMTEAQAAAQAAKMQQEHTSLKQEWGQAYEENVEMGRRAARQFGLDEAKLDGMERALGTGELFKLMAQVGRGLGEGKFVSGDNKMQFGLTPEAASQRIAALRADPDFSRKYLSGNVDARAEMDRLHAALGAG